MTKEKKEVKNPAEDTDEDELEEMEKRKSEDMISKAEAAAIRIEEANKKTAELLAKQEALLVERTLSGKAQAGTIEKSEEQKEIESARNLLKGSGFEDQLFPQNKA